MVLFVGFMHAPVFLHPVTSLIVKQSLFLRFHGHFFQTPYRNRPPVGYPWVAANGMLPVWDDPNCLMLSCGWILSWDGPVNARYYCSARMDTSLAGIWTSGTVQGHSSCFSILINSVGWDLPHVTFFLSIRGHITVRSP